MATWTDPARSAQMARVKGRDTKPELVVRRALHAAGLRYRLQERRLPGRPDIVFPSCLVAVQVRGCFWHRHDDPGCALARLPKSKLDFWGPKLTANAERDARNDAALRELGWQVEVVWECELSRVAERRARLDALIETIVSVCSGGGATARLEKAQRSRLEA